MEHVAPAPKDNPVVFTLPNMTSAFDASQAAGSVLTAVSEENLLRLKQHVLWDLLIATDELLS